MNPPAQKPTVLAADDSVTVRKLIEISLPKTEFDLHFAVDGQECLRKAIELQPDLILLDYILPDMKGIQICQTLLASPHTRHVPVLLISGNGAAIRQTYENLSNVADYLTKPFAPNVLVAVVGHQLAKRKAAPAPATGEAELGPVPVPAGAASKPIDPSAELRARLRSAARNSLPRAFAGFPALEALREGEPPEEYYWRHLEASGCVAELEDSLLALADFQPPAITLRTPIELCPPDVALRHLQATRAHGRLSLELPDETVSAQFENGEIVYVTSNHPKRYCAGAQFNFRAVPPPAVAAAVNEQQRKSTPFFLALLRAGALPAGTPLAAVLRAQGEATLARAITCKRGEITFEGIPLASDLTTFRLRFSLGRLLQTAYRTIDDWLVIESAIPNFDVAFTRNPETTGLTRDLNLSSAESQLLSLIDGRRTVQDLITTSGRPPYQVCRQLYPLVRLGLLLAGSAAGRREAESATTLLTREATSPPAAVPEPPGI